MVEDIDVGFGNSQPNFLTNANGTIYFTADDGAHGPELWKSDGTVSGTVMVKDINPGQDGSNANNETSVNGVVYFKRLTRRMATSCGNRTGPPLEQL